MEEDAELVWEIFGVPDKDSKYPFTSYKMVFLDFGNIEEANIQKISKK